MLETRNLTKVYKPKKGLPVKAIDNISLRFPDRGMVFLLGKSGSGKSTLLNLLGGLDKYDSGEIIIKDVSSRNFKQGHFDSYRNTYVGFIFQEYNVLEEFTVGANIALALELQGKKADNASINEILREVDLEGYGARRPNELSGGQKQRVAIARALVKNPEIIMADEPTGALDSNTGRQIFDTLKKLSADKLVIVVSHDREFAEQYADRIIELADGHVISDVEIDNSENSENPENVEYNSTKALEYDGASISIPQDYELTESDLEAINAYIKKLRSGVKLNILNRSSEKKFKNTDQKRIVSESGSQFKLIRSKLPFKNAFKIGASGLKYKKIRLVFTIILSVVAFSLFGLSDTFGAYNHVSSCTQSILDSNINYASFQKAKRYEYDDEIYYSPLHGNYVSDSDIELIEKNTGVKCKGVFVPSGNAYRQLLSFESQFDTGADAFTKDVWVDIYSNNFGGFVEMSEEELEGMGCTLTSGRLPNKESNEIAISEYVCKTFIEGGYRDASSEDSGYETISKSSDMVGKTLLISKTEYTITGIIDTGLNFYRYSSVLKNDDFASAKDQIVKYALFNEFINETEYSLSNIIFVAPGFIEDYANSHPVINKVDNGSFSFSAITDDPYSYVYINIEGVAKLNDNISSIVTWIDGERTTLGEKEFIASLSSIESNMDKDKCGETEFYLGGYMYSDSVSYNEYLEENGYKMVGYIDDTKYEDYFYCVVVPDSLHDKLVTLEEGLYSHAVGAMPKNYNDVKNIVSCSYDNTSEYRYQVVNAVTYELDIVNSILVELGKVFLYVGIGFAIFASLMFANFIGISISHKKQEIGILRAIGSRSNDVFRIFFSESFIIASINFVISCIITGIATAVINSTIRNEIGMLITILDFGPRQIILLLAISIAVAFIASFIPVHKIASKRPIDAIRNR